MPLPLFNFSRLTNGLAALETAVRNTGSWPGFAPTVTPFMASTYDPITRVTAFGVVMIANKVVSGNLARTDGWNAVLQLFEAAHGRTAHFD